MVIAVFDVDGVVADVRHRLHFIAARPKDWAAFFAAAADDPPLVTGVDLARELAATQELVWLTGRPETLRAVTRDWLAAQGLPVRDLVMRREYDRRPARIMKRDRLRRLSGEFEISVVVDDDPEVIDMVRAEGLPARLADWVPRETPLARAQEREGRT